MRVFAVIMYFLCTVAALAEPAKTAVFDLELLDMSREGEQGLRADETQRLALVSAELRKLLEASDQLQVISLQPQAETIRTKEPLLKCNGCEEDIAKALGADLAVLGHIQKTSNLILSFVVTIKDVKSGKVIRGGQVDIRGNNDEMWMRGVRWLVKNRLLAEPLPIPS